MIRHLATLALSLAACYAQTISITNLGSVVQTTTFTPAIALVEGSASHTYRVCIRYNGKRVNPNDCSFSAPWSVPVYVGLPGDGDATFQAIAYDVFGNVLASSPIYTQQVRLIGLRNSLASVPTSGAGSVSPVTWSGHNFGGACPGTIYVDGRAVGPNDDFWTTPTCGSSGQFSGTLKTYRFPDGPHEIWLRADEKGNDPSLIDPIIVFNPFTVSGTSATAANHWMVTNNPVAVSTTGILPTDSGTGAPLVAGRVWTWDCGGNCPTPAPTNRLASPGIVASNHVVTVNLNGPPGVSVGATVDVGGPTCAGSFTVASVSATSFTYNAPGCADGTTNPAQSGVQVVTNAYYPIFVDGNTVQLSHSPGGAAISFSNSGTGTHTLSYRLRPKYWAENYPSFDQVNNLPTAFASATVTFSNGSHSMELRPPYWELHLCLNPTPTCPSSVSIAPKIVNTDLTTTTIASNSVIYNYSDDGGFSGVAGVNSTTGVVTAAAVGWFQIQVACLTCDAGGSLPPVTIYGQVQTDAAFPHFAQGGAINNKYTAGSSFFPTSWWFLDLAHWNPSNRPSLLLDSGINTTMTSGNRTEFTDPTNTSCISSLSSIDTTLKTFWTNWGIQSEYDLSNISWPPIAIGTFAQNLGYNRQSCLSSYVANLKASGHVHAFFAMDEINAAIGYQFPTLNGTIGAPNFTNVVVSGGVATANVWMNVEPSNWNQSTGLGAAVFYSGATNTCLNGWHPITSHANNGLNVTTSYTFSTTCPNGTYNASTDSSLTQRYMWSNGKGGDDLWLGACELPKYAGSNSYTYQTWTLARGPGAGQSGDISLSSMVSNGSALTVYYVGHGLTSGQSIHITGATNAALNTIAVVSNATVNTFTIPTTAAPGTYNSSTDPNLILSVDCGLPNNYFTLPRAAIQAGANIPLAYPLLGSTYGTPSVSVKNWDQPNISDWQVIYHSDDPPAVYGEDASVWTTVFANPGGTAPNSLGARAYMSPVRKDLLGTGGLVYLRLHAGYLFDPSLDRPNELYWRPETFVARLESNKTFGISGARFAWWQWNNQGQYNIPIGNMTGGSSIGNDGPTQRIWGAISRDFLMTAHEQKYVLSPRGNAPYLGPMFTTTVSYNPTSGNMLKIVCLSETSYTQSVDLTGILIAGGSIYRGILTGYSLRYAMLSGTPNTDTLDLCQSPGQTTTYYAQPPGATPDLANVAFSGATTIPSGATKMAIRLGYYAYWMDDDPVTECTNGCNILINRYNADAWYQILYLDATNAVVSVSDPTKFFGY